MSLEIEEVDNKGKKKKKKQISYDSSGVPKIDPVHMIHATMLYQPVYTGSNEKATAHVVALGDDFVVAAIFTGASLGVYFAGSATFLESLPEELKTYSPEHADQWNIALGTTILYDASKALGAILCGINATFNTPIPDLSAIAYKGVV